VQKFTAPLGICANGAWASGPWLQCTRGEGRGITGHDTPAFVGNPNISRGTYVVWKWSLPREIWGFHGGGYEECRLVGYKNPALTSQETNFISTSEYSQLMLCNIWDLYGGDYEGWRLLRYNNPACTSQETNYVSATESGQLILCKIWDFHGGEYEQWRRLGCYEVWLL
jgi:hypothetical protein